MSACGEKKKPAKREEDDEEDDEDSKKKKSKSKKPPSKSKLPSKYTLYRSEPGKYQIMMPGTPFENEGRGFDRAKEYASMVEDKEQGSGVVVSYADYDERPKMKDVIADLTKGSVTDVVVREREQGDAVDGQEITFKDRKGRVGRVRVFRKKYRLYKLAALALPEEEAAAWMDSFAFL